MVSASARARSPSTAVKALSARSRRANPLERAGPRPSRARVLPARTDAGDRQRRTSSRRSWIEAWRGSIVSGSANSSRSSTAARSPARCCATAARDSGRDVEPDLRRQALDVGLGHANGLAHVVARAAT